MPVWHVHVVEALDEVRSDAIGQKKLPAPRGFMLEGFGVIQTVQKNSHSLLGGHFLFCVPNTE